MADFLVSAPDEDNVGVVRVFDGRCLNSTPYCTSNPHSAGIPASIRSRGLSSLARKEFALVATDGPPGKFLLFFYGPNQINTAFGDGRRCVGGNTKRLYPARQFEGAVRLER